MMITRGDPSQHRSQGIVERFTRTLADRLFSYQYHKELKIQQRVAGYGFPDCKMWLVP